MAEQPLPSRPLTHAGHLPYIYAQQGQSASRAQHQPGSGTAVPYGYAAVHASHTQRSGTWAAARLGFWEYILGSHCSTGE